MTAHRILLLEASGPESTAITSAAVARGDLVYAVTQADRWAQYPESLRSSITGRLLTDLTDTEHAVESIVDYARRVKVDAVLTTNEYLTVLCAEVCAMLRLPGNDPSLAWAARNKAIMVQRLMGQDVPVPKTLIVYQHAHLITRLAEGGMTQYPLVVKPSESAGSAGVTIVAGPEHLHAAIERARGHCSMYGSLLDSAVLVQEYAEGQEFSVESITQNGITTHLCVTRKAVSSGAQRVELSHTLPADTREYTSAILETARRAIVAAGITDGASHTELIVSPDGHCTVIEIGARLGAGYIGFLIEQALGIDPWQACLDVALGVPATLTPTRAQYACVRFVTMPATGRLIELSGLPQPCPEIPIVNIKATVGSYLDTATDNKGRLGCFVVVGIDRREVEDRASALLRGVRIRVDTGSGGMR